jgi:hypothetical protein
VASFFTNHDLDKRLLGAKEVIEFRKDFEIAKPLIVNS